MLEQSKVELKPTVEELIQMVNHAIKELIATTAVIPRLTDTLGYELAWRPAGPDGEPLKPSMSFYELIKNDDEILKIFFAVTSGMVSHMDQLNKYIASWGDKYKHLWEGDKVEYSII